MCLPRHYSSSVTFSDDELEVSRPASVYTITMQLKEQLQQDYQCLYNQVISKHADQFSSEFWLLEDVCIYGLPAPVTMGPQHVLLTIVYLGASYGVFSMHG